MLIRGAKAVVVNPKGEVLIVRRSNTHPHAPLTNDLPGGRIEDGETMHEGLLRELQEEIGLDAKNLPMQRIGTNYLPEYYGNEFQVELYEIWLEKSIDILLDFEHDKYEWVPLVDATIVAELFEEMFNNYAKAYVTT